MLTLPFHVERPLITAIIVGVVGIVFVFFWWSFQKNHRFSRDMFLGYFRRRLGALEPKKAEAAAKVFLSSMAVGFTCMSLFGFSVALGIIRNGEKYKAPVAEESQILQQYLDSAGGAVDIKELVRQNEAQRDAHK